MKTELYSVPKDTTREYRSVGRFSPAQVRELAPGPSDAVALGCPVALFERVLEKRAAFRKGVVVPATRAVTKPTVTKAQAIAIGRAVVAKHGRPAPAPVITDADRRAQAARIGKLIEDEKTQQWVASLYIPQQ